MEAAMVMAEAEAVTVGVMAEVGRAAAGRAADLAEAGKPEGRLLACRHRLCPLSNSEK